jgi:hypothetical protein
MAAINVRSYIHLQARVCQEVDKSDPQTRQGVEHHEQQWIQKHDCRPINMDYNDWRWRWETAIAILCGGYANTTGYYLGDAIGGLFV